MLYKFTISYNISVTLINFQNILIIFISDQIDFIYKTNKKISILQGVVGTVLQLLFTLSDLKSNMLLLANN